MIAAVHAAVDQCMSNRAYALAFVLMTSAASADTFVCSQTSIRVFPDETGTGVVTPLRVIEGDATQVRECYGLALDSERRELWVATGNVVVFPAEAQGNVAPARSLPYVPDQLGFAVSVAVDAAADEVLVGTADGRIHVFARTATSGAPIRTIDARGAGVATIFGLAVDRSRDEVLVASRGSSSSVLVAFPRTASGPAPLVREPLPLISAGQITVDAGRDEWYVVSGNTVLLTRAGQALAFFTTNGLEAPYGLAIRADRQVFVSDRVAFDPDPVKRFAAHPNGNAPPAAVIINGSAPGKTVYGVATSMHPACSGGNTASCLFRDGFE